MTLNVFLEEAGPDDTIVHIGPCSSFFDIDYKNCAAKLIVVEPDPVRAQRIKSELNGRENSTVLEKAALENERDAVLTKYTFSNMDGHRASTPYLQKLFPGIKAASKFTVPTINAAELVSKLPEKHSGQDILFMDVLGEEAAFLRALEDIDAIGRFSTVIVRAMTRSCFVDAPNIAIMRDWMAERFFEPPISIGDGDPDFPVLCFRQSAAAIEAFRQAAQLDRQAAEIEDFQSQIDAYQKERDDARADLSVSLRLQSMVNADIEDLQGRYARLQREKEKQDLLLQQVTQRLVTASEVFQNMKELEESKKEAHSPEKIDPNESKA